MGDRRGQLPLVRCQPPSRPAAQGQADGLYRPSGRIPRKRGTPNQSSCRRGKRRRPVGLGKPGCPLRPPAITGRSPAHQTGKDQPPNSQVSLSSSSRLPAQPPHDPLPGGRVKGACGAAPRALRAPMTRPARSQNRHLPGQRAQLGTSQAGRNASGTGAREPLSYWSDTGKRTALGRQDGRCNRRLSTDGHGRAAMAACSGLTRPAESGVHLHGRARLDVPRIPGTEAAGKTER